MDVLEFFRGVPKLFNELAESDVEPGERVPRITMYAKRIKYVLQAVIALAIIVIIIHDIVIYFIHPGARLNILAHVGESLAFSAAIDLAYMLFTPGPDEAIDPIIVAIAAAILILVSSLKEKLGDPDMILQTNFIIPALAVLILVSAIVLLLYSRQRYRRGADRRAGSTDRFV